MELPKTVWDSAEPDRKRVSDEKRAHRPIAEDGLTDQPTPPHPAPPQTPRE